MVKKNKLMAIASILAGVGFGIAVGWYVFTGTPRYSLGQLQKAIQTGDREEIKDYIDVESISVQIVDTGIETAGQQASNIAGDRLLGTLSTSLGIGVIETIRPAVERQIEKYINQALQPSTVEGKQIKLAAIERAGNKTAIATFDCSQVLDSQLPSQFISVILQQQPSRQWRIVALSQETLDDLVTLFARPVN